jgi:hypothetical protein
MRVRVIVLLCVVMLLTFAMVGLRLLGQSPTDPDAVVRDSAVTPTGSPTPSGSAHPHSDQHHSDQSHPDQTLADGFVVHRLQRGEQPPQFVVVSFDGAGWDEKWDFWSGIAARVSFRFTGFLSGTYLLSSGTRDQYQPPYYPAGTSEILWYDAADVPVEIINLNRAIAAGDEIGTHFNGHFCTGAGLPSGGNTWKTADWNEELDQFFHLLTDYRADNGLPESVVLDLRPADIRGARTPCLEGLPDELYPALRRHGLDYDSSFSNQGIAWPTRSHGIWQIGMAVFPVHGRLPDGRVGVPVTTMDYNFYFTQRGAVPAPTNADSTHDSQQVLETYRDMYAATSRGNRAPLVLGNHFNEWNNNAYTDALATFVLETCGRPQTQCVTYSDLVAWMQAQNPKVLARLQARAPELGGWG